MTTGQQKAREYREQAIIASETARVATDHLRGNPEPLNIKAIELASRYVGGSGFPVSGDELARMTR